MASLAEIRAKLKSQEVNRSTSNTGGDNAIYKWSPPKVSIVTSSASS